MKKILLIFSFLVLFLASPALAESPKQWVVSSGVTTADGAVVTEACYLYGVMISTDATNAVTLDAYDNATTNTGTQPFPTWTVTTSATDRTQGLDFNPPVYLKNGLYTDFTCAGTFEAVFYYRKR